MNCRSNGPGKPRTIPDHHNPDCRDETCTGCQECTEPHCVICSRTHTTRACAECVARTREDLTLIRTMCGVLPEEATHKGVNGAAMMLWGPTADPEAWGHRAMSALSGRLDDSYLEDCRDEQHPLWVLGYWAEKWRIHLQQHSDLDATLDRAGDYLSDQMHHMASLEEPDFEQFAKEVRACRAHLQVVLHDQNQGDSANIGCFDCGARIERRLTPHGFEDVWTCQGCHRKYTYAEYNFAIRAHLEAAQKEAS